MDASSSAATAASSSNDGGTPSSNNNNNNNKNVSGDPLETAKWTQYLPQVFGIREAVRQSSYRWCVREGGMWGIATGTAMSLHRLRMGSTPVFAGHVFFGTFMVVMLPSYYFCYRRREHQEEVIEMMMKYNQFGHATDLPAEPPIEEHPFWEKMTPEQQRQARDDQRAHDREFRGMLKERKEWQQPQETPAFEDIFNEERKR
eukprot:CAMPEP_0113519446 /NCGR_PEP_ID=MMETSP0014_2-20120614/43524_1 /TAXON_ID=2857 /ORGANISM="Nitzschia sp." /LENGTH=201 /DNA_ID=CAMNT_0000417165 /DNA_START=107 /DNA_END=712 /DNA_ORIENTATION=+ /assembly_acc=CAM_ASM_000159